MDELDLARRAVERRVITEDQLKEARSFAEGGRSLLSVLLDLGYLRSEHLHGLMDVAAPAPPRPRRGLWLAAGFILGVVCLLIFAGGCPARVTTYIPNPADGTLRDENRRLKAENEEFQKRLTTPDRATFDLLRGRGMQLLREAEALLRSADRLTPETQERFQDAAVLLDAAAPLGPMSAEDFASLGRAREVLFDWPRAYSAHARALQANPRHPKALLGVSRAALELDRNAEALKHAQNAVALYPTGQAYFLLGRAKLQSDQKEAARRDLLKAQELDPSLSPLVANLLERLSRQ